MSGVKEWRRAYDRGEITKEEFSKRLKDLFNKYQTSEIELRKALDRGEITEEEFSKKMRELHK